MRCHFFGPWGLVLAVLFGTAAHATEPVAKAVKPASARAAKDGYLIEPAPSWVQGAPPEAMAPLERAPMHYALIDEQVRVEERTASVYSHVVRVVDEPAGLAQAAQLEVAFDPSYQSLVLHHLDVVRDGKRLSRLDPTRLRVLHRETELERQMLDGRLTLSVVVPDVRVGDRIDYAYTRKGVNPVFGPRFFHITGLGSGSAPVAVARLRLLAPVARALQLQAGSAVPPMQQRETNGWRDTTWQRMGVPQLRADVGAPSSVWLAHQVHVSELAQWAEVARWGEALFVEPGPQRAVDAKAAELRAAGGDRADQLRRALVFVQQEIRYFGTEMGLQSHRPAAPERVLEQRHGDCKDKVALLVALLRRLDIPAAPVLVSADLRGEVERLLPTPLAFDHAIARVELDGTTYWLDATRDQQTGTLARRQALGFLRGLVLDGRSAGLATLPSAYDTLQMQVEDRFRIERFADDAQLESRILYRGPLADVWRAWLNARSLDDVKVELAQPYLKLYPQARATAPLRVERSDDDDAVTFVQTFRVPAFWRYPDQRVLVADLGHWSIMQALSVPKIERRHDPLAITYPGRYRHVVSMQLPEAVWQQPSSRRQEEPLGGPIGLRTTLDAGRDRAEFVTEARLGTDRIEPADWDAHVAKLTRHFPHLSSTLTVPAVPLSALPALERAVQDKQSALRARRVVARTQVQMDAVFRILLLDAHLAGGRLSEAQRAQALLERGTQYDHQGEPERAKVDFDRALELAPDDADVLQAAAVNAMALHRLDRAIELADAVLRQRPAHPPALDVRARAHYLRAEWAQARADWQVLLDDAGAARRGYPLLWMALLERQEGHDPRSLATRLEPDGAAAWPRPLAEYLLGRQPLDTVIQAAKTDPNPLGALCEAYFYIGERFRAEGNLAGAAEYWHKAAELGVTEYVEDVLARFRLVASGR